MLLQDGVERVTITDFGLARAVDDASMTRTGVIAGTLQFMSPEQSRGDSIDGRSGLFSVEQPTKQPWLVATLFVFIALLVYRLPAARPNSPVKIVVAPVVTPPVATDSNARTPEIELRDSQSELKEAPLNEQDRLAASLAELAKQLEAIVGKELSVSNLETMETLFPVDETLSDEASSIDQKQYVFWKLTSDECIKIALQTDILRLPPNDGSGNKTSVNFETAV